jgi:hypothetical protein
LYKLLLRRSWKRSSPSPTASSGALSPRSIARAAPAHASSTRSGSAPATASSAGSSRARRRCAAPTWPANPFVSCSSWDPAHDIAVAESRAAWVTAPAAREHAWACFRAAPPPLGYDPATIWPAGLEDPAAGVIRLEPWRLKAAAAATLAAGEPAHVWRG